MWLKRLEKDKFPWPTNQQEALGITRDELKMILNGIDFWLVARNSALLAHATGESA